MTLPTEAPSARSLVPIACRDAWLTRLDAQNLRGSVAVNSSRVTHSPSVLRIFITCLVALWLLLVGGGRIMSGAATLRYLDATAVLGPAGELRNFQVSDATGALGTLSGFVVDPAARQLRYFVVEVARWLSKRRYLIPLCPAVLQPQQRTVTLDCEPNSKREWREFDDRQFSRFSDDDLIDALFATQGSARNG